MAEILEPRPMWKEMKPQDMAAVSRLAALCHPDLPEDSAVLAEKQKLAPQYCFALAQLSGEEELLGYMLAHPWRRGDIPPLNRRLGGIPQNADIIYLHDLALDPAARGQRLAEAAVIKLCAIAVRAGFAEINLAAVHCSAPFWQKQGFMPQKINDKNLLRTYGADAVFMAKSLRA